MQQEFYSRYLRLTPSMVLDGYSVVRDLRGRTAESNDRIFPWAISLVGNADPVVSSLRFLSEYFGHGSAFPNLNSQYLDRLIKGHTLDAWNYIFQQNFTSYTPELRELVKNRLKSSKSWSSDFPLFLAGWLTYNNSTWFSYEDISNLAIVYGYTSNIHRYIDHYNYIYTIQNSLLRQYVFALLEVNSELAKDYLSILEPEYDIDISNINLSQTPFNQINQTQDYLAPPDLQNLANPLKPIVLSTSPFIVEPTITSDYKIPVQETSYYTGSKIDTSIPIGSQPIATNLPTYNPNIYPIMPSSLSSYSPNQTAPINYTKQTSVLNPLSVLTVSRSPTPKSIIQGSQGKPQSALLFGLKN